MPTHSFELEIVKKLNEPTYFDKTDFTHCNIIYCLYFYISSDLLDLIQNIQTRHTSFWRPFLVYRHFIYSLDIYIDLREFAHCIENYMNLKTNLQTCRNLTYDDLQLYRFTYWINKVKPMRERFLDITTT